ncbi:MAG: sugar phosphate isomerase/epimerase family protein [Anaerolineales bacterium]
MRISIVTDEISADPETAIELGVEWGVRDFELRGFGQKRVPMLSEFEKDRIGELLEEFQAQIVAISPGLFKFPYPTGSRERFPLRTFDYDLYQNWRSARDLIKYHMEELLPKSIEFAKQVGAELIVIFSFHRGVEAEGKAPDELVETLRRAASEADKAGISLVIEPEDEFWADTGARTSELVEAIDHPALAVNWDPGNAIVAGDTPYPDGYSALRQHVRHVHFKDVKLDARGAYTYVLEGDIDWAGQIRALADDGYSGHISVETHMGPKISSAREMTRRLKQLIESVAPD